MGCGSSAKGRRYVTQNGAETVSQGKTDLLRNAPHDDQGLDASWAVPVRRKSVEYGAAGGSAADRGARTPKHGNRLDLPGMSLESMEDDTSNGSRRRNSSSRATPVEDEAMDTSKSRTPSKRGGVTRYSLTDSMSDMNQLGVMIQANAAKLQKKSIVMHQKMCKNSDLRMFRTIKDAYPYNDNKKKTVDKKEKIVGGGRPKDWGRETVPVLGRPMQIECIVCEMYILDKQEEKPFYCCKSCQAMNRRVDVCVTCYDSGVLLSGAELQNKVAENERLRRSKLSKEVRNEYTDLRRSHLRKPSLQSDVSQNSAVDLHCGKWTGTFTEAGHTRNEERKLHFDGYGNVKGGCGKGGYGLVGVYSLGGMGTVSWTESHDWGEVEVSGQYTKRSIVGTFKTSDGGHGKLTLRPSK